MSVPPPTQLSVSSSDSNSVTLTWFNAENYDKVLIAYVLGDNPSSPITQQFDFNDPNPSVVDLSSYTVTGIDSTSGHAFVFKVKGGKRSDIFGAGITWDYSDWTTFVWNNPYVGSFVDSGTERTTNIFALSNFRAVENAHTFPGHFSWYEHLGAGSGSFTWGVQNAPITLTTAPSFRQLFYGGDGVIYGITNDNFMQWFRLYRYHGNMQDKQSPESRGFIGEGWGDIKYALSGSNGVIYAITNAGNLLWYRHAGFQTGTYSWAAGSAKQIGRGWQVAQFIFSGGGNGVIYAVINSQLRRYHHAGFLTGDGKEDGSTLTFATIANNINWSQVHQVFSAGLGIIYVVLNDHRLFWFQDLGFSDFSNNNLQSSSTAIGTGWQFDILTAGLDDIQDTSIK